MKVIAKKNRSMKVIAVNNGPLHLNYDGSKERRGLIKGKEYDVISWSYQKPTGHWVKRTDTDNFVNPEKPSFFIKVINEDGQEHEYWNDYFLSTEEMREIQLNELGIA